MKKVITMFQSKSRMHAGKKCVCKKPVKKRLLHFLPILTQLRKSDAGKRREILKAASPCLVHLISECGHNILKGNLCLPEDQYKNLKPHKRLMLLMSKPTLSIKLRRDALLKKKGGFLPVILPFLLSAISGFAGQALAKSI
jgi:hypothetical protein